MSEVTQTLTPWDALRVACWSQLQTERQLSLDAAVYQSDPTVQAITRLFKLDGMSGILWRGMFETVPNVGLEPLANRRIFAEWLIARLPADNRALLEAVALILSEFTDCSFDLVPSSADWPDLATTHWRINDLDVVATPSVAHSPAVDVQETLPRDEFAETLSLANFPDVELASRFAAASSTSAAYDVLIEGLDQLVQWAKENIQVQQLDVVLEAFRAVAMQVGMTITPTFWTYSQTWNYDHLTPEEQATSRKVFDGLRPRGQLVRVNLFGLQSDPPESGIEARAADVSVSIGPILDTVKTCISLAQASGDEAVWHRVKGWGELLLNGTFDDELKDFYIALHSELGESWRLHDEDGFVAFRDAFHVVLSERKKFRPFIPKHRNDHPSEWMVLVGRRDSRTGRVRRVVQPGLIDSQGRLISPARVEIE